MHLTPETCYRALCTRDPRFDGRFFVAVRTTGVYCRPICPARTPRRENCTFVPCAAAAEEAGYRPCRRCRPESAPGTPAWLGTSATVSRGLRLIADGALDANGVGDLAARLGLGERQLRRLFTRHLGAAPLAIARTRRVHFAAELLAQTDWPVSRVALASGFTSLRRFNEAIRDTFHRAPREVRAARRAAPVDARAIRLPYRAPFDTAGLFAYLAARAVPGVEQVGEGRVQRALRIGGRALVVEVDAPARERALEVRSSAALPEHWLALAERVRSVFDLRADPAEIGRQLGTDPLLRARLRRRPGVRVPGAWDPFEIAVRIVLGQQVTVAGATQLAGRLAERFGERMADTATDGAPALLFPEPDALADAPLEEIGLTRQRAGALRALAAAVAGGKLALVPGADPAAAREALLALPGIGPWTAELVLLRALGEPDAFPAGDLGLCRALGCDAGELERRAERWRPWRGYAAMLLWTVSAPSGAGARRPALMRPNRPASPAVPASPRSKRAPGRS